MERDNRLVEATRPAFARKHRAWHAKSGHFGKPLGARTMDRARERATIFSSILARRRGHDDRTSLLPRILRRIPCLSLLSVAGRSDVWYGGRCLLLLLLLLLIIQIYRYMYIYMSVYIVQLGVTVSRHTRSSHVPWGNVNEISLNLYSARVSVSLRPKPTTSERTFPLYTRFFLTTIHNS